MFVANNRVIACERRVQISVHLKRWRRPLFPWLVCIVLMGVPRTQAQLGCPAPWNTAANVYGIVTLDGGGTASNSTYTQTVNQHAVAAGQLRGIGLGSCAWQAVPYVGLGQMKSQANENDTVTFSTSSDNWFASGAGDPMWDSLSLSIGLRGRRSM